MEGGCTRTAGSSRALGLGNGVGDDGLGEVEVLTEEEDTFVGEEVVVVLPAELLSDVSTALQALHGVHNLEVRDGNLGVLGKTSILLDHNDTLYKHVK